MVESVIEQDKLDVQEQFDTRSAWFSGLLTGNSFERADRSTLMDYERAVDMVILPLEDYTRMTGESLTLGPGEAYFCCPRVAYTQSELHIGELSYQIKGQLPDFGGFGADSANITTTFYLIVPDFDAAIDALQTQDTRYPVVVAWQYSFDSGSPDKEQIVFLTDMLAAFAENKDGLAYASYTVESLAFNRDDFQGTYGSLFFLAILLSIVFLAAAVLILYYKQISEGYEDQARFEIMQRVGMTKTDIRKSINSQLLLVFFLPLLFAGLHLGFAFPFVHKMLVLFNLTNLKLLIGTTVITFAVYAVFYAIVYPQRRMLHDPSACASGVGIGADRGAAHRHDLLRGPGGLRQLRGDRRAADRPQSRGLFPLAAGRVGACAGKTELMYGDRMKKVRSGASGGVFYLGLALIGVLAIPAAVLLGLIAGVWTLTDKLTALLEKKH